MGHGFQCPLYSIIDNLTFCLFDYSPAAAYAKAGYPDEGGSNYSLKSYDLKTAEFIIGYKFLNINHMINQNVKNFFRFEIPGSNPDDFRWETI